MKAELIDRWVTALESGEYNQGEGGLRIREEDGTSTYCCLGVLADVIDSTKWIEPSGGRSSYQWGDDVRAFLPDSLIADIELEINGKTVLTPYSAQTVLSDMNDNCNKTFPQIAQYIRENVVVTG